MTFSKIFLPNKPYGVKVNGIWVFFNNRYEYVKYLNKCIAESSDVIMFKAIMALENLRKGIYITDIDLL